MAKVYEADGGLKNIRRNNTVMRLGKPFVEHLIESKFNYKLKIIS